MKTFNNKEEVFASQNYDPAAVEIKGVPEHHVAALKALANLFVAHDAVNPDFQPDFTDRNQDKFEIVHVMGSPSGSGFSFCVYGHWGSDSHVGSRLVSENTDAAEHIAELFDDDFKAFKVYERPIKK